MENKYDEIIALQKDLRKKEYKVSLLSLVMAKKITDFINSCKKEDESNEDIL